MFSWAGWCHFLRVCGKPTVHAEMNEANYWSESVDYMKMKVDRSGFNSENDFKGNNNVFKVTGSIGNDFSPQVNYVISVD